MPPMCVFITAVPISKLFAWGEVDSGGHVLRETPSRGLCGLVCPLHTRWAEGLLPGRNLHFSGRAPATAAQAGDRRHKPTPKPPLLAPFQTPLLPRI